MSDSGIYKIKNLLNVSQKDLFKIPWRKSGVYRISNPISNKFYIGSAKNIRSRCQKKQIFLDIEDNTEVQQNGSI